MLVSSLLYTTLSKFVQFVEDRVWLLECSPPSCQAPRNNCEEKHEKFITRRIHNKSPSHFGFDTCRHSAEFWKASKSIFFSFEWMKNSFSRGKMSLFERNTILSHPPGTLKVFFWLIHFLNNVTLFISCGAQLACFAKIHVNLCFRRNMQVRRRRTKLKVLHY